jgi:sugar lactone lactonase YvrE
VRLWGSGFSTLTSYDTVRINGVLVRVDSPSTSTVLLVTLIDSTGTGPVAVSVNGRTALGPVFTYLTNPGGPGQTAPVISGAETGWYDGSGYAVNVKTLPATDDGIKVFVGGVEVAVANVAKPGSPYYNADKGFQLLINDDEKVRANGVDIYANFQVTYNGVPSNVYPFQLKPVITDIFSRHGDYSFAVGDTITITGNFFGRPTFPSSVELFYNGLSLQQPTIISWANTQIRAVMPAYPTVQVNAGIPTSVMVGQLQSTRYACNYLGVVSGTVSLLAGSDPGYADGTGAAAKFNYPAGIALDASGNLYVADRYNNRIRMIASGGSVTTLAGGSTAGFRDGGAADAWFNQPLGVGVDENGVVYVADFANNRIRMIHGGIVTTFIGDGNFTTLWYPTGLAIKDHNLLYVADMNNHRVREIINATVFTVAGGGSSGYVDATGAAAMFNQPYGVALAADGSVYVADAGNHAIRKVSPTGVVTTLAGGTEGKADGTGAAAKFEFPLALALDAQGNILVADFNNYHIRKVTPQGVVSTLTGEFADGSGVASFSAPSGIAVDAQGAIYISDAGTHRIYKMIP